jgi:hypothetical protein
MIVVTPRFDLQKQQLERKSFMAESKSTSRLQRQANLLQ